MRGLLRLKAISLSEFILILSLVGVITFAPPFIYPALVITLFYYLSKTKPKKRSIGISLFRTFYFLLGVITNPLLNLGPQLYVAQQLKLLAGEDLNIYKVFLIFYQVFFSIIFPLLAYLTSYLLTIVDWGGFVLPVLFLSLSSVLLLFSASLSESFYSPLGYLFLALLLGHLGFFLRPSIQAQIHEGRPIMINTFHYIYAILGFLSLQLVWYVLEHIQELVLPQQMGFLRWQICLGILFAIGCLLSSSLLVRQHSGSYRIPFYLLTIAILMDASIFYLPLFLLHHILLNRPAIRKYFA
jgi:hypothetical protein